MGLRPAIVAALLVAACGGSDDARHASVRGDAGQLDARTGGAGSTPGTSARGNGGSGAHRGDASVDARPAGRAQGDAGAHRGDASADGHPPRAVVDGSARAGEVDSAPADLASCVPEDASSPPPRLMSAALIAPDAIGLVFSEPVLSPAGADLSAFRLSLAMRTNVEGVYVTVYTPLHFLVGPDGGATEYSFSSLRGGCARALVLRLAVPLPISALCAAVAHLKIGADPGTAQLYLHHAPGVRPAVESPALQPLGPVSPEFATAGDSGALPSKIVVIEYLAIGEQPPPAALPVGLTCPAAG